MCKIFLVLMETQWANEINVPSRRILDNKKPIITLMPVTADLIKLSQYINEEITTVTELTAKVASSPSTFEWMKLANLSLASLILFNRRREGEAAKIKLLTYVDKPDYRNCETDLLRECMSPAEKLFLTNIPSLQQT